jgi:hypothetical protein
MAISRGKDILVHGQQLLESRIRGKHQICAIVGGGRQPLGQPAFLGHPEHGGGQHDGIVSWHQEASYIILNQFGGASGPHCHNRYAVGHRFRHDTAKRLVIGSVHQTVNLRPEGLHVLQPAGEPDLPGYRGPASSEQKLLFVLAVATQQVVANEKKPALRQSSIHQRGRIKEPYLPFPWDELAHIGESKRASRGGHVRLNPLERIQVRLCALDDVVDDSDFLSANSPAQERISHGMTDGDDPLAHGAAEPADQPYAGQISDM